MGQTWAIGIDSWVIQDGNYEDFSRGQERAFAVELYAGELAQVEAAAAAAVRIRGETYDAVGEVVFASKEAWVLDCGIMAYRQQPPPAGVEAGAWLAGAVGLGVDPFFYFEELARIPGMPPLVYAWHIERIELNTTPFIEVAPKTWQRDPSRAGWRDIDGTDAWKDDDGRAAYILHCRLLDREPQRHPHR